MKINKFKQLVLGLALALAFYVATPSAAAQVPYATVTKTTSLEWTGITQDTLGGAIDPSSVFYRVGVAPINGLTNQIFYSYDTMSSATNVALSLFHPNLTNGFYNLYVQGYNTGGVSEWSDGGTNIYIRRNLSAPGRPKIK